MHFKRIIVKEELILLTGHFYRAILLNYFLEVKADSDWISKKSEMISSDCLLDLSKQTIRKHLKTLVDDGFLMQRRNPNSVWDKTMQYKVNLEKIHSELMRLGAGQLLDMQSKEVLTHGKKESVSNSYNQLENKSNNYKSTNKTEENPLFDTISKDSSDKDYESDIFDFEDSIPSIELNDSSEILKNKNDEDESSSSKFISSLFEIESDD